MTKTVVKNGKVLKCNWSLKVITFEVKKKR
jgi:hypothetical protein